MLLMLAAASSLFAQSPTPEMPPLVPLPAEIRREGDGVVDLASGPVVVEHEDPLAERVAADLRAMLGNENRAAVTLRSGETTHGDEGYTLDIDSDGRVTIEAATPAGLYYGCQTLRQLLQLDTVAADSPLRAPVLHITDAPRFGWRGLHIDSGRHMQSVEELKKFIDLLALHKMNRLHWHLTEDQGWRLEIEKYPKLTEIGAWREESPKRGNRNEGDGQRYGGFYTKQQVREVVAYAEARFVTVVPEIEVPGHTAAALAAYPEFGNTDVPGYNPQVVTRWGIFHYTFAPTPEALQFIDDVLREVFELFPGEHVHIGGDEAPTDQWEQSPSAQAFMQREGITDPHHVQAWFNAHLDTFLAEHGKRMIGWDEILQGPLSKRTIVMSWRGVEGGQKAAAAGHDVIMAPNSHTYFDHYQAPKEQEPHAISGHLPLEKVYAFNPVDGIDPIHQHHVLGVQGQLWSEYIWSDAKLEYMAFPRACALAEVAWTPQDRRMWDDFSDRLDGHLDRLRALGVNYRQREGGAALTPVE